MWAAFTSSLPPVDVVYFIVDTERWPVDKAYVDKGENEGWLVYRRTVVRNGIQEMEFRHIE